MADNNKLHEKDVITSHLENAIIKLIGVLTLMGNIDSFLKDKKEIDRILNIIINWGTSFEKERNLNFVSPDELLEVYDKLNRLNDIYLYDKSIGYECFLADEIMIWYQELMEQRKRLIELK